MKFHRTVQVGQKTLQMLTSGHDILEDFQWQYGLMVNQHYSDTTTYNRSIHIHIAKLSKPRPNRMVSPHYHRAIASMR